MPYIKFDTITSTNDFLKSYCKTRELPDFFYVLAEQQTKGRGQSTKTWQSDCCKNILLSIYLRPEMALKDQNILSQIVALSIVKVLQKFNIPAIKIKLPNDILADGKKIAGILIENSLQQQNWKHSIIGIGLNVLQTEFEDLPHATSMKTLTGQDFDRSEIVNCLLKQLKIYFKKPATEVTTEFNKYLQKITL